MFSLHMKIQIWHFRPTTRLFSCVLMELGPVGHWVKMDATLAQQTRPANILIVNVTVLLVEI